MSLSFGQCPECANELSITMGNNGCIYLTCSMYGCPWRSEQFQIAPTQIFGYLVGIAASIEVCPKKEES